MKQKLYIIELEINQIFVRECEMYLLLYSSNQRNLSNVTYQ